MEQKAEYTRYVFCLHHKTHSVALCKIFPSYFSSSPPKSEVRSTTLLSGFDGKCQSQNCLFLGSSVSVVGDKEVFWLFSF